MVLKKPAAKSDQKPADTKPKKKPRKASAPSSPAPPVQAMNPPEPHAAARPTPAVGVADVEPEPLDVAASALGLEVFDADMGDGWKYRGNAHTHDGVRYVWVAAPCCGAIQCVPAGSSDLACPAHD